MDRRSIQDIRDSLDAQLAAGKLDLETYRQLTTKWQARLAELAQGEPGAPPGDALRPAMAAETIACPECSAPLEDTSAAPGQLVRCGFCRATFTLKRAREQSEIAGQELRRWLQQMVTDSGAGGAVDAASRRFIFTERLYPALLLEWRRSMEPLQDVQQHPMLYLDLLAPVAGYRIADHVLLRSAESLPKVRSLSLRINSPLVAEFALGEDERRQLRGLDFETSTLVYLANLAGLLQQPEAEAYAAARENVTALSRECADYQAVAQDQRLRQYLQAMRMRLDAVAQVLGILATVYAPDADPAAQVLLEEIQSARAQLAEAARLADDSGYDPLAVLPFRTGLQREERIVALLEALLDCYRIACRGRAIPFPTFCEDLGGLLRTVCSSPTEPGQLALAVEQAGSILRASRGEPVLRFIDDWSWCQAQIEGGRHRSILGGETVAGECRYWHPFWCAQVRYTVARGTLLVSGVERIGYGIVDALGGGEGTFVPSDSAFAPRLSAALEYARPGDGKPILPPLTQAEAARSAIVAAARAQPNLRHARVSATEIVYLPAVSVCYRSKGGLRWAVYSVRLGASPAAAALLSQVGTFFARYA
ncbi:MAG: hypothetical protein QME94_03995 [Anaerolineae bacterium]|nr:hypothetical protein [Anaerolineae bacterium]